MSPLPFRFCLFIAAIVLSTQSILACATTSSPSDVELSDAELQGQANPAIEKSREPTQTRELDEQMAVQRQAQVDGPLRIKEAIEMDDGYDPELCLDQELEARGLNRYGHPKGLSYTGGTPLFNERTGERVSRREYLGKRFPELLERCPEKKDPEPLP